MNKDTISDLKAMIEEEKNEREMRTVQERKVLSQLFSRYSDIVKSSDFPESIDNMPIKCQKMHLLKLVNEALTNLMDYPHDKLYRWLGFTRQIIDMVSIKSNRPVSFIVSNEISKSVLKECFEYEKNLLESYPENIFIPPFEYKINKSQEISFLEDMITSEINTEYPCEVQHLYLGMTQGMLCMFGFIDVDKERDFTRPLLHSYQLITPKTFG